MGEPRDVAQPVGVGERDVERAGDVEPVRPVLRQPGRRQRRGLERGRRPGEPLRGIGVAERGDRGSACVPPPLEHHRRLGAVRRGRCDPSRASSRVGVVTRRVVVAVVEQSPRLSPACAGHHRFLGLGQVQHDVGDRPTLGARRRRPRRVVERVEDRFEAILLGDEVVEDHGLPESVAVVRSVPVGDRARGHDARRADAGAGA